MKKIINKFKSLKKIEKIQVITTFIVIIFCVFGFFMIQACINNLPKEEEEIYYDYNYIEPKASFCDERLNIVNSTLPYIADNNGFINNAMFYTCCYNIRSYDIYKYVTIPIDIRTAFQDMRQDLQASDLSLPQFTIYVGFTFDLTNTALSVSTASNQCYNYGLDFARGFTTPAVYEIDDVYFGNIYDAFYSGTKLMKLPSYTLDYSYVYLYISVWFVPSVDTNEYTSIIFPYSDSITSDSTILTYTNESIEDLYLVSGAYDSVFEAGKRAGKIEAYNERYTANSNNTFVSMINAILTYPITFIRDAFDVEFMGLHIAKLFLGVISIVLTAWLIKKLL